MKNKLIPKARFGWLSRAIRGRSIANAIDKSVSYGVHPNLYDRGLIYRTTTPKEVSVLSDGEFIIRANDGNHGAYGWRIGAPFYQPGSYVERKMLSKRNDMPVDNPVYLTTPVDANLMIRVGSGGKYGDLVASTSVHPGSANDYQITGSLYFPEESSVAFLPGDKLPQQIRAWQKVNGQWQFQDIEQPKRIYQKIRIQAPNHTIQRPREIVLEPQGDNKYYLHIRTWDDPVKKIPANLTNAEKNYLFQQVYDQLPQGAEILFPQSGPGYYATRGTVAALQRLGRDSRFTPGDEGVLYYEDRDGIKEFTGTSFIKK